MSLPMLNQHYPLPKKILVVEDDEGIREALTEALEYYGYQVVTAKHGQDGLERLQGDSEIGLILLDMRMPVMNGHEFLKAVSFNPTLATVPVLVLSANADPGQLNGVQGFFRKPIDTDQLIQAIGKYV